MWRLRPFTFLPPSQPRGPLFRGLDAPALDDSHGRRGLFAGGLARLIAQAVVYPLDGSIVAPLGEVVVDAVPLGEVAGQHAPLAAGAEQVEHRVEHVAQAELPLASTGLGRGQQRFDEQPLLIAEVGRVVGSHANPGPETTAVLNSL